MAYDPTYENRLKALLSDPSSFSMSPDAQVGLQTGLGALNASNSATRGSGGALAALTKYGVQQAQGDYGNQVNRLAQLTGQSQQYDVNQTANANTATRNANDLALGHESNANTRYATDQATGLGYFNDTANYLLGAGANANNANRNANDFTLGTQANNNTAANNWMNYDVNQGRNANDAAGIYANYDINQGRNAIDWYNAGTNRGSAQSNSGLNWYRALPHSGTSPNGGQWFNPGG